MIKRISNKKYLKWLRTQPCCMEGYIGPCSGDIIPCHQTLRIPERAKGIAQKDHDIYALPMCFNHHCIEGADGVETFWGILKKSPSENIDEIRALRILQHLTRFLSEQE